MIETFMPLQFSLNFLAVCALVLAAIAIYVFRPRKKLVIIKVDVDCTHDQFQRVLKAAGESARYIGVNVLVLPNGMHAVSSKIDFIANIDAREVDENKIREAIRNTMQHAVHCYKTV
jgi:hypothetical protein